MRLITIDDFVDVYQKLAQRGATFILSKFKLSGKSRTLSAFDNTAFTSSNWWIIPKVRKRWNKKITGAKELEYEHYMIKTHFSNKRGLKMLSIGSGVCSHEIRFAASNVFEKVLCVDIAANLLEKAEKVAIDKGLNNMEFKSDDIFKVDYPESQFDVILFHSSLHHMSNVDNLLSQRIRNWLNPNGILIINEYVGPNRLQFDKKQLQWINKGIKLIPKRLRKRFKTNIYKSSFYGSGYLRMVLADPSECIESANILPSIHSQFEVIEEKPFGGNLLMHILKDISHNFIDDRDTEVQITLNELFELEDEYLKNNPSDFIFGVYRNKK